MENGQNKLFYSTGEACVIAGISAHTLRYWERKMNMTFLRSPRGKRMLRHDDIEMLKKVASLLREGYTLKAVPSKIRKNLQMEFPMRQFSGQRRILRKVRDGLAGLLSMLGPEMSK